MKKIILLAGWTLLTAISCSEDDDDFYHEPEKDIIGYNCSTIQQVYTKNGSGGCSAGGFKYLDSNWFSYSDRSTTYNKLKEEIDKCSSGNSPIRSVVSTTCTPIYSKNK